jgi:type I restriction enzyme S subunit
MSSKKLSAGWTYINLGDTGKYINGRAFKTGEWKDSGVPIIRIQNLNNRNAPYNYSDIEFEAKFKVKNGDLLVAWSASLGVYIWEGDDALLNQHIFKVVVNEGIVNKTFLYYSLKAAITEFYQKTHGSGIVHITRPIFENHRIKLPPLREQQLIVEKLDTVFTSLGVVKTKLDRIAQLLSNFRQAVLSQAVTGKLTSIAMVSSQLSVLLEDVKYGTSKKSDYAILGVPILRIPNIKDGEIDSSDIKFSVLEDKEFLQLKLQVGDILVIRSNGSSALVGQCAVISAEHANYAYAGYLIRLRVNEKLNPEFLNYVLKSSGLRAQIEEMARSTNGINNINSQEIKNLVIPLTGLKEQQAIVNKIKTLFSDANQIEKHYKSLKLKVDHLPEAILSKAFSGDLVSQNPDDEPASELLLRIKDVNNLSKEVANLTQVVL